MIASLRQIPSATPYGAGDMKTRILPLVASLSAMLISSTAFAWSMPIHKCWFPRTPTPVGEPIPCSYTNQDGQTFNGVVTTTSNGEVLCTGLIAPNPSDPTEAASIDELYSSIGEDYGSAPFCALEGTDEGPIAECWDEPPKGNPEAVVKVCGDGWCLELTAYVDCNDYYTTEAHLEGVTCYDLI
jgi:hypothetical protein